MFFYSRNSCQTFSLHTCANNNNKYNNNNNNKKPLLPALMLLVTMCPVVLIWNEFCFGRIDYKDCFIGVELFFFSPSLEIFALAREQLTFLTLGIDTCH